VKRLLRAIVVVTVIAVAAASALPVFAADDWMNLATVSMTNATTPTAALQVSGTFTVSNSAQVTTPSIYVGSNGNVGVGTSAPSRPFHVVGKNTSTGGVLLQGGPESSTAGTALLVNAGAGTNLFQVYGNGYTLIGGGGSVPTYNLQVNQINSSNTYFGVDGTKAYFSGNVGIGTVTPTLQVCGTFIVSSTVTNANPALYLWLRRHRHHEPPSQPRRLRLDLPLRHHHRPPTAA
jgi:hypothetical protein